MTCFEWERTHDASPLLVGKSNHDFNWHLNISITQRANETTQEVRLVFSKVEISKNVRVEGPPLPSLVQTFRAVRSQVPLAQIELKS